jgi:uncharacterized protein HemX
MVCLTRVYFVILLLAKKEAQMDELEQDYLKHQIRQLERSNRRWKFATFALAVPLAIILILGVGSSFLFFGVLQLRQQTAAQRALAAEQAARLQAKRAAQQLQQMEKQAKEKDGGAADKPDEPELKKVEIAPRN